MHIPDGFIDTKTAIASAVLSAAGLGLALAQLRRSLPPRGVPYLGLSAAFVFSAQMVNFPVLGGTSGHIVGGALVPALLGPPSAIVVLSTVLMAQCFLFADGGVSALGANILNMAIVAPVVSAVALQLGGRLLRSQRGRVAALAFAAWCSTVAASLVCAGQLAWSGTISWKLAFPAMAGIHMLIGLGEAIISALIYAAILRTRPQVLEQTPTVGLRGFLGYGLVASLGLALFAAPFACGWPDGLDSVARRLGFENKASEGAQAWFADYRFPGVHSEGLSIALAGALGALLVFLFSCLLSRLVVREHRSETADTTNPGPDLS